MIKAFLGMFCFLILTSIFYAAAALPGYIHRQLETETAFLGALKNEVEPLLEMADQITLLKSKYDLEQQLLSSTKPVHDYILLVQELAVSRRVSLETITADKEGNLIINGHSRVMKEIASFNSALEKTPGITSARVKSLNLNSDNSYTFEIEATWIKHLD